MTPDRRDYLLGIGLLLVVVLEWTGSGFLTQGLFDKGYEKPFLVTYLNTSAFSFYLIPFLIRYWRDRRNKDPGESSVDTVRDQYQTVPTDASDEPRLPYPQVGTTTRVGVTTLPPLTTRETAHLASIFCFFWFLANWSVNTSLDYTTVASSTILSSMSGFFTLGVGKLFGVESFNLGKLGAVLMSTLGVLLVSLDDSNMVNSWAPGPPLTPATVDPSSSSVTRLLVRSVSVLPSVSAVSHSSTSNPIFGDCLALFSAVFYALYVTLLKVRIRTESRVNMQLFFGFVGVLNVVTLWPVGVILHLTGVEPFEWPGSKTVWAAIGINMFITLSSDYIYLMAMLKTTPLLATVGLSLTIPFAVIGDWSFLGIVASWQALFGALLVLGSFVALGIEGGESERGGMDGGHAGREGIHVDGVFSDDVTDTEQARLIGGTGVLHRHPAAMTATQTPLSCALVSHSPVAS